MRRDRPFGSRDGEILPARIPSRLAVLDYLTTTGLPETAAALRKEAGLSDYNPDGKQRYSGLLEKKWTSVIRLQKKVGAHGQLIMELEGKLSALSSELSTGPPRKSASSADWIPRPPERKTLMGHKSPVTRVAFHPVFMILASASEDATIKIWDSETGEFERTLKGHTKAVQDVAFDSKGNLLVSCSMDLSVKVWDTQNEYTCIRTLHGHDHSVSSVVFTPSGDSILTASRDRTIKVWEVASGYCTKTISGHSDWVRSAMPSDDGRLMATCSNDQSVRVWDLSSGECKGEMRGHEHVVECVAFAPTTATAAIRTLAGVEVRVWIPVKLVISIDANVRCPSL
ncbi:WD40-repeat-containing domain protein [Blyttiomyces helicus]|uniref:WD40-repeat-containing domain protein n=1 Tax=Blyttiomyces helicus TaxID=388810 RepID=A0A4P9VXG9_9FUNG|nr:WD40-repeat-containing domain protein [Blyttiomyces helicus]|eukprot:RKO84419.1 WD40-repeat-containing domain protein [Blyttiomyces helicus]